MKKLILILFVFILSIPVLSQDNNYVAKSISKEDADSYIKRMWIVSPYSTPYEVEVYNDRMVGIYIDVKNKAFSPTGTGTKRVEKAVYFKDIENIELKNKGRRWYVLLKGKEGQGLRNFKCKNEQLAKGFVDALHFYMNQSKFNSKNIIPNNQELYNKAYQYFQEKEYTTACEELNKLINLEPNNTKAISFRGYIYLFFLGEYDKAILDFSKVIQLDPDHEKIFYFRGNAYYENKNYIKAVQDFTTAINNDKDDMNSYFLRALTKTKLNDYKGAIRDYDKILNLKDTVSSTLFKYSTVYNNKAYCLCNLSNYDDALKFSNIALDKDKTEAYIWDTRGEIYFHLNEFEKCISDMNHAISIKEDGNSYFWMGLAKLEMNRKEDGCTDLSKSGELGKKEAYEKIQELCN